MSKRNIIIAVIAIITLGIATLLVTRIDTDKEKPQTTAVETYTVYSADASDLSEVRVAASEGEIRAVNNGKSEWGINDLPMEEIDSSKAYSLAGTVSTIISKNKFESPTDLGEYGLDNPSLTVTITKKDGQTDTLYIGNMSPALGEYFIRLDGDDNVYTMYSYKVDTLLKPVSFYTEFDRFNVNIDDITRVKIQRTDGTIEIKLIDKIDANTNNVWEMVEPYKSGANDDYIDNKILAPIEDISLTEPVKGAFTDKPVTLTLTVKPYDSETGKYGKEYEETIEVGDTEGNITYVYYKGNLYTTPSTSVAFVKDNAFNIVSKLQALVDISLVKNVAVEYGSEKHEIDIKSENNGTYSFKLDGKEADTKVSQEIYRNIIALAVDATYNGEPADETVLRITFNGKNSGDTTKVEIKQLDNLNCVVERDGKAEFTIKKSKVDEFITIFDAYVKANTETIGKMSRGDF